MGSRNDVHSALVHAAMNQESQAMSLFNINSPHCAAAYDLIHLCVLLSSPCNSTTMEVACGKQASSRVCPNSFLRVGMQACTQLLGLAQP